jgi:hypothetical protein
VHPRSTDCILGGTLDVGAWDTEPDPEQTAAILARCIDIAPELSASHVIDSIVGLRPGRPTVRVETDHQLLPVPVIHNYGHGGSGITIGLGLRPPRCGVGETTAGFVARPTCSPVAPKRPGESILVDHGQGTIGLANDTVMPLATSRHRRSECPGGASGRRTREVKAPARIAADSFPLASRTSPPCLSDHKGAADAQWSTVRNRPRLSHGRDAGRPTDGRSGVGVVVAHAVVVRLTSPSSTADLPMRMAPPFHCGQVPLRLLGVGR